MEEELKNGQETEKEESVEPKVEKKSKKKRTCLVALGTFVIGLILLFTLTSYRLIFSPKKITFLSYMTKDVERINTLVESIEESVLAKLILNDTSKSTNIDLELDSKKIDSELITDKDFVALKINDVTENYLLLENKKIDDLLSKLGLEGSDFPSKIEIKENSFKLTNGEKRKIFTCLTDCATNVLDNLDSEKIKVNDKVKLSVNGETQTLKSIEIQFSENDLFMLQKEFLTGLKNDKILNIFIEKINKISIADKIDKKEIEKEIEKYIAYLDYAKAYYDLQETENDYYILYRAYSDENNVVAREIVEKYKYQGQMYEDIICSLITSDKDYYEFKWFTQDDYSSAYYTIISDKITSEDNSQNHEIKYAVEGFYVGESEGEEDYKYFPVNGEMIYNVVIEKLDNGETKVELIDPNNLYNLNLSYTGNNAQLDFATRYNEIDIEAKVELKTSDITKEELLNNGALLINDKTQEDLMIEFAKMGSKLSEIFGE